MPQVSCGCHWWAAAAPSPSGGNCLVSWKWMDACEGAGAGEPVLQQPCIPWIPGLGDAQTSLVPCALRQPDGCPCCKDHAHVWPLLLNYVLRNFMYIHIKSYRAHHKHVHGSTVPISKVVNVHWLSYTTEKSARKPNNENQWKKGTSVERQVAQWCICPVYSIS